MLRSYQKDLISRLRLAIRQGNRRIIAVLPTGGGKTFTFTHIVKGAVDKGRRVLILTDRIELLRQAGGALQVYGLDPIEIKAGRKPYLGGVLYTAMVETLARRVKKKDYQHFLQKMQVVIIDEAHMRSFDKLFPYFSADARVLGFTATPRRMGRKNQLGEYYHHLEVGVEIEYLVDNGFLAEPNYYGVESDLSGVRTVRGEYDANEVADRFSKTKLYRGVVENWKRISPGEKTLVFASNIASSQELITEFTQQGVDARHLDATVSDLDRRNTLAWFDRTPGAVLCNVGILTKGFDQPDIRTVILYRATKSVPLYLQMCGRGSRMAHGKTSFNILDFGGNIARHGFWHDVRPWSLEVMPMQDRQIGEAVLKNCKQCEAFIPTATVICPHCGYEDVKEKEEQQFARLQLLDPRELRRRAEVMTMEGKIEMAKKGLVKPFWVIHQLGRSGGGEDAWEEVKRFVSGMGWSPYWFSYNYERFWWKDHYLEEVSNGSRMIKVG
ncbi:DEAD/DEAH box helicase [Robiginitalea biformata]|uniref:Putative helicase n=1 Tax=Robiginitalea biformata (strain ATCC BAA-864 / DSM 15991 / KCTC 12146 / HTCC2501) TaxID=313596 RepID=A4CPV8_ROBBH|nr:DEAD/DEAH box helicase [Robiginitalea biformata]EAR14043.1 putative helicase [Robiginitalea biformata HTCC2501]